jgi:hypothetical protein
LTGYWVLHPDSALQYRFPSAYHHGHGTREVTTLGSGLNHRLDMSDAFLAKAQFIGMP